MPPEYDYQDFLIINTDYSTMHCSRVVYRTQIYCVLSLKVFNVVPFSCFETYWTICVKVKRPIGKLFRHGVISIAHFCTKQLAGYGNLDNQCKYPMDKDKDCRVEQLTTPSKLHNRYVFADVNEIKTTHLYVFLESCVAGLGKSLQKSNSLFQAYGVSLI